MVTFAQAAANIGAFGDRALAAAPLVAEAMAEHGRNADKAELTAKSHAAGTPTPAGPGESPAMITGTLAASIENSQASPLSEGVWQAIAGPTPLASSYNGPYGRFLEYGGLHAEHNETGAMHWFEDGRWHKAEAIFKVPRPYLVYAMEGILADGSLHDVAVIKFAEVVDL